MARTQKQKATQTHAVSLITLTNPSSPIAEQGNPPLQQTLQSFLLNQVNEFY